MKKCMLLASCLALFPAAVAAQPKVVLADLIRETQQHSLEERSLSLVWWLPEEFWQASSAVNPEASADQVASLMKVLRPYVLVAVIDGQIGPMGGFTFTDEPTLRSRIKIVDARGSTYHPFTDKEVSADAKNLTQMLKPVLANSMGPFGENVRFFLFPARDAKGAEIADATSDNDFDFWIGEKRFHWRLPLGSLLPPKVCPEDGELLSGAWSYCPWHGTKLKPQEPAPGEAKKQR